MKDENPEKVKGREECAKGRQTRTKKASSVHEHSVALKESHSNENAVSCFGQVNEVVSSATSGALEQSYDISPYQSSDGEEDDDVPTRKVIPSWSRQYCLAPLSCSQQPKDIFKLSSFCNINQEWSLLIQKERRRRRRKLMKVQLVNFCSCKVLFC
ncbi:hypothetical protein MKW92_052791 [Papaver armeniacum]|nr:hypothetical protein MKW92_052791 [Papaver armeniacum]